MEKKKNIPEVETTAKSNVTATKQTAYQQSDAVKQAQTMLQQQAAQKPGAYQSPWQNQLNDVIGKIMNRENFSYDLNGDALYQQYKDRYITQGKMAMMDTIGQAAALTGGYGNSYAQSVGQQAYHGYLQQLNDKIPELYQLALSKFQMEGDDLKDQASLIAQMENQDYGRYRDQVSDYNTELDRLQNRYDTERNFDYGQYVDDRNYLYQLGRDAAADAQWQKEFDEAKRQYDQQFALKNGGSTGGSSRGSSGKGGTSGGPGGGEPVTPSAAAAVAGAIGSAIAPVIAGGGAGSGGGDGFTGTTYSEAVAHMKQNGVPEAQAVGILTQSEWQRAKKSNSPRYGANEFDSYAEYLEYAVDVNIAASGK